MHPVVLAAALATTPTPSPSATPLKVIETIYTSDRRAEPIDQTSRPTFVVTRAQIVARGARTVAQALEGVPGVTVSSYGAFGAQAGAGIRGASSQQTLVLLDGTPVAAASNGVIDLNMLSTIGVSRIEVVEGGVSTLYGTAAVGGVVNVITDVPRRAYVSASEGSFGDRDLRATLGDGRLGVAFDRHIAENDYAYAAIDGLPAGTRSNADGEASSVRLSYQSPQSSAWQLRGSLGSSAVTIGVPGSLVYGLTPYARQWTSFDEGHVELRHRGARSTFSVTLSGSRQALPYQDPGTGPGQSVTYDGRGQVALKEEVDGAHSTLIAGIDLARESALSQLGPFAVPGGPSEFVASASQAAVYAQQSWTLNEGARLFAGLRGEHDAPSGGVVAPEVGAVVPVGSVRLAANAGEAFRVPTLIDLYYPGASNPNLQPERTRNVDFTLQAPDVLGGASLGWFGREANDLITFDLTTFTPQNVQHASIQGLTETIRTKPLNGIVASLGLTDLYRAVDTSPGANDARLKYEPTVQATLGLERPFIGRAPAFGVRTQIVGPHVDAFTAPDGSTPPIDAYTTLDAYVRVHAGRQGILTLRGRNLGNETYANFYGYPMPGRFYELEYSVGS